MINQLHNLPNSFLQATQSQHAYLLLDASQHRDIPELLKKSGFEFTNLFEGTPEHAIEDKFSPLLLQINPIRDTFVAEFDVLLEAQTEKIFFSVFTSRLVKRELIKALQKRMQICLPDGEEALFRFYDPLVLRHVKSFMNEAQQAEFFAPMLQWWWLDEKLQFITLIAETTSKGG